MTPSDPTPVQTIRQLIDHLQASGVQTQLVQLVAHVRLLYAGERDNFSGQRVQVFQPVATQLDFVLQTDAAPTSDSSQPLVTVTYCSETVSKKTEHHIDADDFNGHVRIESRIPMPGGIEAVAGELMRSLIDKHREITGEITSTYEKLEVMPGMIESIKRERFDLRVGLERLAKYLELDSEWRHVFVADIRAKKEGKAPSPRLMEIGYEKLMLTERFLRNPCPKDLFMDLRREFAAEGSHAMDFIDYYEWFKRSQTKLDDSGKLNAQTRADMEESIRAWHAAGGGRDDFRDDALSWTSRNFEIHPRHHQVVADFIDEVAVSLDRPVAERPRP